MLLNIVIACNTVIPFSWANWQISSVNETEKVPSNTSRSARSGALMLSTLNGSTMSSPERKCLGHCTIGQSVPAMQTVGYHCY